VRFPKLTHIQIILCALFIITICSSVISLGYFIKDKPNRVNVKCEVEAGLAYNMRPITLNVTAPVDVNKLQQRTRNCTTTTNPPMSANHEWITNFATVSAIAFVLVAGIAYVTRKRDPLDPADLPEQ